jgi:hypothetical protein
MNLLKQQQNSARRNNMQDPTREEMLTCIELGLGGVCDEFDREEAIYWFACNYHGGQDSNLYSVLSTSEYNPGPVMTSDKLEGMALLAYSELEAEFGN